MRSYCSLADSRYLPQLLTLYESLVEHSSEPFVLYVLPLDLGALSTLRSLALADVVIVDAAMFESEMKLTEIKASRTHQEYAWTCASQLCFYLMSAGVNEITYLDADCMAFSDPEVAFKEIGARSIAITLHRLIPSKKYLEANGRFNVGWVTFRNDLYGRMCLSKWAAQVRERCSAQVGCGDQLYLDDFVRDHGEHVCVFQNIGVNAAPWNIGNWSVTEGPRLDGAQIITFHAHEYRHGERLTNYALRPEDIRLIYDPYTLAVEKAHLQIDKSLYLQAL